MTSLSAYRVAQAGQSLECSQMAKPGVPQDAVVIRELLDSMGVRDYESTVIHQLMNLMYRYTSDILQDADAYHERAGRPGGEIGTDDVLLAIQGRESFSFAGPPPQDMLVELANQINSQQLPEFSDRHGLRLPHEDDCLLAQPYRYVPHQAAEDTDMHDSHSSPSQPDATRKVVSHPPMDFRPFAISKQQKTNSENWEGEEPRLQTQGQPSEAQQEAEVPATGDVQTAIDEDPDDVEWI